MAQKITGYVKLQDSMITALKEKGYQIVPISELIYTDKYHMNHEGRQIQD